MAARGHFADRTADFADSSRTFSGAAQGAASARTAATNRDACATAGLRRPAVSVYSRCFGRDESS